MLRRILVCLLLVSLASSCSSSGNKPKRTAGYESEEIGQSTSGRTLLQRFSSGERYRLEKLGFPAEEKLEAEFVRGQYLVLGPAACGSCHSKEPFSPGSILAGGRELQDEFSSLHAANITPDPNTGIGRWNIAHVMRALRSSLGYQKRPLSLDVHSGYEWMSDADMRAIGVYLFAQQPVESSIPRRELSRWERNRYFFFPRHSETPGYVPAIPESPNAGYGKYLATAVAQCTACHTNIERRDENEGDAEKKKSGSFWRVLTRLLTGQWIAFDEEQRDLSDEARDSQLFAKVRYDQAVKKGEFPVKGPNIRGNSADGLKDWTEKDIVNYLSSGRTPSGGYGDGRVCRWPYFRMMNDNDKKAVALYLKSLL